MQRTTKSVLCILSLVIAIGLWLKATVIQVPSGTWAPAGNLAEACSGASSVLLQDGTILVTGGESTTGALASAEFFSAGSFAAAPAMNVARSRHAAVVLQDGRVLVTGGKTTGGGVTNAAEIYVPAANSWTVIASMADARSGHAATLLKDGRVLLTGGEGSAGAVSTFEAFDPVTGTFAFAGTMSSARKHHAAALLPDGKVLVAGGSNGSNVLASTDIYDPETGAVTAGPALSTPRAGLSATTLMDGNVLIAGGNNGTADLATAEVFNSTTGVASPVASSLATARRDHSAFLLPYNNHVLILGGKLGGTALASAELFRPWDGNFHPTGSMLAARTGLTGSPLGLDGLLVVAGGSGAANSELYGFATIKTDKDDYHPGELVTMTGSGWQPGETVTLFLHEINNPDPHDDLTLTVVADGAGRIVNNQFAPDQHDVGIRFYLTASGANSNLQALTTFTDAELVTAELAAPANDVSVVQGGPSVPFTISVSATGSISQLITSGTPSTARVNTSYTLTNGVLSSSILSTALNFFSSGSGCSGQNCDVSWTGAPTPYAVPASISANVTTTANNYTITLSPSSPPGSPTVVLTNPAVMGGKLDDTTSTAITVHVRLAAPSNLTALGVSQTQINLNWTDNSTGESAFVVEGSANPGGPFVVLGSVGAGITSYSETGLSCGTSRNYRVKATKTSPTGLDSDYSGVASGSTTTCSNPPTGDAGGPYSVAEGGSINLAGSANDPDGDPLIYSWDLDNNGTFETAGQNPTFSAVGRDGPSTQTVVLKVCDNGTPSLCHTDTSTVNILNAPPVANAGTDKSGTEGSPITFNFSCTDAGTADTWTGSVTWGDGSPAQNLVAVTCNSGTFSAMHTYADDDGSPFTVTLTVTDDDGGSHSDTALATVANAPPVANAGADQSGTEGSPITFTFSCTDVGSTDTWTGSVNWGDGSPVQNLVPVTCNSGTFSAMHTYGDNAGSPFTVTLTVTDDDFGSHSDTAAATVANAPPVANAGADKSGTEGSPITFNFSCTDAGTADTWTGSVNWGDGSPVQNLGAVTCNSGTTFPVTHTYADNHALNPFTVTLTVTDDDGASHSDTATAAVANVPPSVASLGLSASTVTENGSVTLSGMFTDPGTLDTHVVVINWGDGSPTSTISLGGGVLGFGLISHQYLDDNPTGTPTDIYPISVTVTDNDGGVGSGGTSITVNNALPLIGNLNASPSLLAVNNQTTVTTTFTDVGTLDTHTCTIDWDDGSTTPGTVASGTCSGTKIYAATGVYAVSVEIQDDDTGKATTKYEYVVVYDPSAGFVTGGGWIQSPAGAYRADLSAMGKANFGFVSKYLKGSSIPTGETEFQLHFANFNFHSTSYQWLVVSGPKAQYKGSGKVNGAGNYGFLLTATDGQISGGGGTDRFRIKIWDISNGDTVVYDNVLGASDDIDAANPQGISGGSITIHAPKK